MSSQLRLMPAFFATSTSPSASGAARAQPFADCSLPRRRRAQAQWSTHQGQRRLQAVQIIFSNRQWLWCSQSARPGQGRSQLRARLRPWQTQPA